MCIFYISSIDSTFVYVYVIYIIKYLVIIKLQALERRYTNYATAAIFLSRIVAVDTH
jgi:hypothetical protein